MKFSERDLLVYGAENASGVAQISLRFDKISDAQAYAYDVLGQEESVDALLTGVARTSGRNSWCVREGRGRFQIQLLPQHLNAYVVLHEVAHALTPEDWDHGANFCATLLRLVRTHLGFHAYGALKASFDSAQVSY